MSNDQNGGKVTHRHHQKDMTGLHSKVDEMHRELVKWQLRMEGRVSRLEVGWLIGGTVLGVILMELFTRWIGGA